ncbi:MAG: ABC transporter transmembrane domain-containing protein, partial [Oscillospiraceae bacterium]|nr:ABC transporter transmembrane domain-containing protein [Oscillospiraceae bacterium]
MLPLDNLSDEVEAALKRFGVDIENIIMAASLDLDVTGDFGESWICLDKENLYCLSANSKDFEYDPKEKKKGKIINDDGQIDEAGLKTKFSKPKFEKYPVENISDAYIDSFTSTNRLFAIIDGVTVGIAFSTNSRKQKLFAFLELMKRVKEGKEVKDDDAIFEQFNIFCPKCGRRYHNQNRKVCMNCVDKNMLFTRLLKYFEKHMLRLALIFATLLISAGLSLVSPLINGKILVDLVLFGDQSAENFGPLEFLRSNILAFSLLLVALNVFGMVIGILRSRAINKMSIYVTQKMKTDMFSAMQKLSLAYFNNNQTGRLMNRINSDPEVIGQFYTGMIPNLIINIATFVGVTIMMFLTNWQLTLIVFIPVPVIIWIFRTQLPKMWRMYSRRWRRSSSLNSVLGDSLSNIRVVKAFAKEVEESNRFRKYSERLYQADLKVNITRLSIFPLVSLLIGLTGRMIWGFGGVNVIGGTMSYGNFLTYLNFISLIFVPLETFATLTDYITEMTNSAQRVFEVMDAPRDIVDAENPLKIEEMKGEIEFDDVCFHYVANRPILRNMSFKIKQGDYIGLVGHTGAGKSTIANLITRMYDVISGSIKIDGHNIK